MDLNPVELVALPLVGGVIGWITNAIAVKMLFRPRRPVRVLGMTWIGLLPKRRADIALKVARIVEAQLFSAADVKKLLSDPALEAKFLGVVGTRLDEVVTRLLDRLPPMVRMLVPGERVVQLRAAVVEEIARQLPALIEDLAAHVETKLDVKKTIEDRMLAFEIDKLEAIIFEIARTELRHIEILGGVLGALIGLVQALVMPLFR